MKTASFALAILIGMLLPLQALINAALGRHSGAGALFAALASFSVGTLVLGVCWLAMRPSLGELALAKVPWWAWTGGAIGAIYVAASTLLISRTGAASLICLVVAGQLIGSLLLDHYGVLQARQPVDAVRLFGALLVAAGALLVVRPWQAAGGG
ncbi:DMT family transporter [Pseudoxanthomonas mexicana]|uniref:DMT family transporter n=1 Tax=Pseudoxanthomonas mexicana TaxID=128785 RepID=UPI00398AD485